MIAKDDSNSSVVLQILEFKGYLQKTDGNWTPTPKAVVAGYGFLGNVIAGKPRPVCGSSEK